MNMLTLAAAIVGAVGGVIAVALAARLTHRVQEVHVLVNNQLHQVMTALEKATSERDEARRSAPDPDRRMA